MRNPDAHIGTEWAWSVEVKEETTMTTDTGATSTSTSMPMHSDTLNIIHVCYNHFLLL